MQKRRPGRGGTCFLSLGRGTPGWMIIGALSVITVDPRDLWQDRATGNPAGRFTGRPAG